MSATGLAFYTPRCGIEAEYRLLRFTEIFSNTLDSLKMRAERSARQPVLFTTH